mmetsp:Transcript_25115/g.18910  ORF Transcript_25115/g.18910 Transcript_25115/m.18910 type:complete len:224 (+) Transcript_25115:404-1075(+)
MYTQEIGALGHGDKTHYFQPKKVEFFKENGIKVKQVRAGLYHTVALTDDGKVYTWGRGLYGVLGNGTNAYSLVPLLNEEIESLKEEDPDRKIVKIDSADEYTGVLFSTGELYVWGKNDRGQLGVGAGIGIDIVESESSPVNISLENKLPIVDFHTGQNTMIMLDSEGGVHKTGLKLDYTPKKLGKSEDFEDIVAISCGRKHYVVLNKHNKLLVWGNVLNAKPE